MKYCPNCQTKYTDDTLRFCLQDGTPLAESQDASGGDTPTVVFGDQETLVSSRRVEPIRVELPGIETRRTHLPPQDQIYAAPPTAQVKKSNTGVVIFVTALVTLLLLGGAAGAWFLLRERKTEVAVNVNTNAPKSNGRVSVNGADNQTNAATNSNANAATPTPSATPTPKPTLKPEEAKTIVTDVEYVIDDWEEASENLDIERHLSSYAPTVDYYQGGKVGVARVRADKQRAFEQYDSIDFNISNLKITPDASGEKATAVFDKEWNFEGANNSSSGKVQQQLTLGKFNGKWKITGEKDLKVYYKE